MAVFSRNVGGLDRAARLIAGAVLLPVGLLSPGTPYGLVMMVVGFLALFTGITRFCILYVPFGISTIRPQRPVSGQVTRRA